MIHKKRGPFARFPFKAIGTWWRGARFPNVTEWARSITNTHIYMSIQPAHRPSCRPTYFPFGAPFVMDLLTFFRILQFLEEGKVWDFFFFFQGEKHLKSDPPLEIHCPFIMFGGFFLFDQPPWHFRRTWGFVESNSSRADRISGRSKPTRKFMLLFFVKLTRLLH